MATSNWLCFALFANHQFLPLHWPLTTRHYPEPLFPATRASNHPPRAPPFGLGDARTCLSERIAKDRAQNPAIYSIVQNSIIQNRVAVPRISGTWSFPDAARVGALSSSCQNRSPALPLITTFSRAIPCACSSARSLVTWTPPTARPCARARAARAAGRAGDGLSRVYDRNPRPEQRAAGGAGSGRAEPGTRRRHGTAA
jgi:hypothetical protein